MLVAFCISVFITIAIPGTYHLLNLYNKKWGSFAVYMWGTIIIISALVFEIDILLLPVFPKKIIPLIISAIIGLVFFPRISNMRYIGTHAKICGLFLCPIFEEIAFRGIILELLSSVDFLSIPVKYIGITGAIMISAILFGLAHLLSYGFNRPSIRLSISSCIGGMFLGLVALHTQSILLCVLYHIIFNSIMVFRKIE